MKRVLCVADTNNWCFSLRARALQRYAPDWLTVDVACYDEIDITAIVWEQYDLIYCLPTNLAQPLRRWFHEALIDVPLVVSHNSGPGRRHDYLTQSLLSADYTVVNNHGCWSQARVGIMPQRFHACCISNGVDRNVFYPERPIEERPHKILWAGSEKKIDQGSEEGDLKGYHDVLCHLEEIMPHRGFEVELKVSNTGNAISPDEMRRFYNSGSYLVMPSPCEGTPNIALEAAACGCVVIAWPTGNIPELVKHDRNGLIPAHRDLRAFRDCLHKAKEHRKRLSRSMLKDIQSWDWSIRCRWFYALWRELMAGRTPRPFSYIDTPAGLIA